MPGVKAFIGLELILDALVLIAQKTLMMFY